MKKFITSILLFAIPFLVIAGILVYIDPYNVIRTEKDEKKSQLKYDISYKINYPLYALQAFDNDSKDIIILGDSRAKALNAEAFKVTTGEQVMNLAYGGGTLQEAIETFWYIDEKVALKKVYIGINFNLYNSLNNKNRVTEANQIRASYASYITSKYCIKASISIIKSMLQDKTVEIGKPKQNRGEFWQYLLNHYASHYLKNYTYPKSYFEDLTKIANHCKAENIELIFFVPPTHIELQQKIKDMKRENEYQKFMSDLESLDTKLYDFNFPNEVTSEKENYGDPLHFKPSIGDVVSKIISGNTTNGEYENLFKLL